MTKIEWKGLIVEGNVIVGDWEGDPSVPRGTRTLDPYVNDPYIKTPDGDDLWDDLSAKTQERLEILLIERALED